MLNASPLIAGCFAVALHDTFSFPKFYDLRKQADKCLLISEDLTGFENLSGLKFRQLSLFLRKS
jgi:hypothetical protein